MNQIETLPTQHIDHTVIVKDISYNEKMLLKLRDRYNREIDLRARAKIKNIGISKRDLLNDLYKDYRKSLYLEFADDPFILMIVDSLIVL